MGLTAEGTIFLILAWGSVILLAGYCFFKVIKSERGKKRPH